MNVTQNDVRYEKGLIWMLLVPLIKGRWNLPKVKNRWSMVATKIVLKKRFIVNNDELMFEFSNTNADLLNSNICFYKFLVAQTWTPKRFQHKTQLFSISSGIELALDISVRSLLSRPDVGSFFQWRSSPLLGFICLERLLLSNSKLSVFSMFNR